MQEFAAAHWLKDYPGNCSRIHGHTWKAEVSLRGSKLDEMGMLVDFREVRRILSEELGKYDHQLLNEIEPFDRINPTAENIARMLYEHLELSFPECKLEYVRIWETSMASACYMGDDKI